MQNKKLELFSGTLFQWGSAHSQRTPHIPNTDTARPQSCSSLLANLFAQLSQGAGRQAQVQNGHG